MTLEIGFVLALTLIAFALFIHGKIPIDLGAILIMAILMLSGIVSPEEGLKGFSNTATVTVAAMFILSAGLFQTGAINGVGILISRIGRKNFHLALASLMLGIGTLSAFINNTAAVAIGMPVVIKISRSLRVSPSKLLMPLSFAAIFGGVCTLIGTSTNLVGNAIAERHGLAPFRMFEFTPLGLLILAIGILYMITIGTWLIPNRRAMGDLTEDYGLGKYVTEIILQPSFGVTGKIIKNWNFLKDYELDVIQLIRDGRTLGTPTASTVLRAGDVLQVSGNLDQIKNIAESPQVVIKPGSKWRDQTSSAGFTLLEVVLAPNSRFENKTLRESRLREQHSATVLAIRHRGELVHTKFKSTPLQAGDALLVEIKNESLENFRKDTAFIIVTQTNFPFRKKKTSIAIAITAAVILAAALNWIPIVIGSIIGCLAMIFTGCITLEETYKAIEWKVIFLLAGVLTLGVALEKTGGAQYIARLISDHSLLWGPSSQLALVILAAMIVTELMSNTATVALLAPIAIAMATSQNLNPRPFLIGVTIASSLSLCTPIGYQTNTMIYSPGRYKFTDFTRVGIPLSIVFAILMTWLIPKLWPF